MGSGTDGRIVERIRQQIQVEDASKCAQSTSLLRSCLLPCGGGACPSRADDWNILQIITANSQQFTNSPYFLHFASRSAGRGEPLPYDVVPAKTCRPERSAVESKDLDLQGSQRKDPSTALGMTHHTFFMFHSAFFTVRGDRAAATRPPASGDSPAESRGRPAARRTTPAASRARGAQGTCN